MACSWASWRRIQPAAADDGLRPGRATAAMEHCCRSATGDVTTFRRSRPAPCPGEHVDQVPGRSRNVRAAGGCSIRLNGPDYLAVRPGLADRDQASEVIRAAFGPVERAMFRVLGIRQYLLLDRADG